jgi:hypothetical protein
MLVIDSEENSSPSPGVAAQDLRNLIVPRQALDQTKPWLAVILKAAVFHSTLPKVSARLADILFSAFVRAESEQHC